MFGQLSIHTLEDLANVHQQDLRREADSYRLAARLQRGQAPVWPRVAWNIGSRLIAVGEWLRARPARTVCTD